MTLELLIKRDKFNPLQTLGTLSVDGKFECYTLEDTFREVKGLPTHLWKVPGKTAIPVGRYRLSITMSNRFKKLLILLAGVLGFVGVRMHAGNKEVDTEGCILLGDIRFATYIGSSRTAVARVQAKVQAALDRGEEVWLTIQ